MRKRCSYPGCTSGSAADRRQEIAQGKKKSYFRFPKNQVRRKQWQIALNRTTRIKNNEVLCELHFKEKDILHHFVPPLGDGTVFSVKRGTIKLSSTAVPHLYGKENVIEDETASCEVDSALDIQQEMVDKEPPVKKIDHNGEELLFTGSIVKPSKEQEQNLNQVSPVPEEEEETIDLEQFLDRWCLFEDIDEISLPDKWRIFKDPRMKIIGLWKIDGSPVKILFIKADSTYQTFMGNGEIHVPNISFNSREETSRSLEIFRKLVLCDRKSEQCSGFVDPSDVSFLKFGKFFCHNCRRQRGPKRRHS